MENEITNPPQLVPFRTIGLCFSGGGYRATSFCLGVLDYLNNIHFEGKPLLENVIALSSVSGGTITAASFAASNGKGESFDTFYEELYLFLHKDQLLDVAFEKFMDQKFWEKTTRTRSVINSLALTYREKLVPETFGDLKASKKSGHLKYYCFNATEFRYGLTFRFQNVNTFGNYELKCEELDEVRESIYLGDAIASSSCFPVGFEPLLFPNDYIENHESETYLRLTNRLNFKTGMGIMDGGIVDNQGIGSMVNMDKSSLDQMPLDLLIVNDVGGFRMPPWTPDQQERSSKLTFTNFIAQKLAMIQVRPIYWILFLLGVLGLIGASILDQFYNQTWVLLYSISSILLGVGGVLTLLGLIGGMVVRNLKEQFKQKFNEVLPKPIVPKVEEMLSLNLSMVKRMATNRLSSGMLMINQVFIRQIRRLNFDLLYRAKDFDNRRITSTVYQLNGVSNNINLEVQDKKAEKIRISDQIKEVALTASEMTTTLWWDKSDREVHRLDSLIACGQFTTCYNLIKYIQQLPDELQNPSVKALEKKLFADWEKFEKDPMFLVFAKDFSKK